MASGLGAIILVLIIVKQDIDKNSPEVDLLQADLTRVQAQDARVKESLANFNAAALNEISQTARTQAQVAALKNDISRKQEALKQQQTAVASIKSSIEKTPTAKPDDALKSNQGGEENYIMGLKVEGRKIIFLIDSSASMTDEKLIDIIRRKNSSASEKKRGPKWQRSKRIARWLLARTPKSSQVAVLAYSNKTTNLGGSGWLDSRDVSSINKVIADLDQLVPSGATNLQLGLQAARKLQPTNLYLLTDGLPTAGQSSYAGLNPFSSCGGLLGRSNTISGPCRVKLFQQTLAESALPKGVKVDVILLPIEGDPQAAPWYWRWTSATGGLLITPAESWP